MNHSDPITEFYQKQLPEAERKNNILTTVCPFCKKNGRETSGTLVVFLNPESFFHGYYRCSNRCSPGGFCLHFARQRQVNLDIVPGFDPDREYLTGQVDYPIKNLNAELLDFMGKLTQELLQRFADAGVAHDVLKELQIGYNGRYLVYPYIQPDGNCYAARCVHPDRPEDNFWYGNEKFFTEQFRMFNVQELSYCENGSLFLVEGEDNMLPLKQLGLPAVSLPTATDLSHVDSHLFDWIKTVFLCVNNRPESIMAARSFATRIGYKVRIILWPDATPKHYTLLRMARDKRDDFQKQVWDLVSKAKSFSPFGSPKKEYLQFQEQLQLETGDSYQAMSSGYPLLDQALGGIHGINIMGGLPKAGKSCFFTR